MDDMLHDQTGGRNESSDDSGDGPAASRDLPAGGETTRSVRGPVIRFCTWCKEICVRPAAVRAEDAMIVYIYGDDRRAFWNGRELIVQDGICERCRAKKFPETLKGKTL